MVGCVRGRLQKGDIVVLCWQYPNLANPEAFGKSKCDDLHAISVPFLKVIACTIYYLNKSPACAAVRLHAVVGYLADAVRTTDCLIALGLTSHLPTPGNLKMHDDPT